MTAGTKIWTLEEIQLKLRTKDEMVRRSLLQLADRQTASELDEGVTRESNGQGFNARDAFILTEFAKQLRTRGFLSPKQITITRRMLWKYCGQLTRIANGN